MLFCVRIEEMCLTCSSEPVRCPIEIEDVLFYKNGRDVFDVYSDVHCFKIYKIFCKKRHRSLQKSDLECRVSRFIKRFRKRGNVILYTNKGYVLFVLYLERYNFIKKI